MGRRSARPSAETLLHLEIVPARGAGRRVAHPFGLEHDPFRTSTQRAGGLAIEGYEMLKGLDGRLDATSIASGSRSSPNDQDMPRLAGDVRDVLDGSSGAHAFLLGGHGLYTWGRTIAEAERHVEILEFLFEVVGRTSSESRSWPSVIAFPNATATIDGRRRDPRVPRDAAASTTSAPSRTCRSRADAPAEELLAAYKAKIDELKARGGYVTADVIDVFPDTPDLDAMLNKFNSEHWHDEDEVRFIIEGRGRVPHPPGRRPGVRDRSRGRAI